MKLATVKVEWMDGFAEVYTNVSFVSNEDECMVLTTEEGHDLSIPVNNVRLFSAVEE